MAFGWAAAPRCDRGAEKEEKEEEEEGDCSSSSSSSSSTCFDREEVQGCTNGINLAWQGHTATPATLGVTFSPTNLPLPTLLLAAKTFRVFSGDMWDI